MNSVLLNRINAKVANSPKKETVKAVKETDQNSLASLRLTYALYNANRAASKINGCQIFNDWHKQGLTVKECNDLIVEYNKITGYVYSPKAKQAKKDVEKVAKIATKPTKEPAKVVTKVETNDLFLGQIEALKQMKKEGLLTPSELVECLKGLKM
jgi:hypothetical protein